MAHPSAAFVGVRDRRVNAVERQAGLRHPLLKIGDSRRIVIIEMRARCKHFDCFEPIRCDFEQMVARQSLTVVQVCRHPELTLRHRLEHTIVHLVIWSFGHLVIWSLMVIGRRKSTNQ